MDRKWMMSLFVRLISRYVRYFSHHKSAKNEQMKKTFFIKKCSKKIIIFFLFNEINKFVLKNMKKIISLLLNAIQILWYWKISINAYCRWTRFTFFLYLHFLKANLHDLDNNKICIHYGDKFNLLYTSPEYF